MKTPRVLIFSAAVLLSSTALADVPVHATLCNYTSTPVEFQLYNFNDMFAGAAPLVTKAVRPCACVEKETHTDLWHNFPPANVIQLVYRDVGSVKGASIKACVDAKGKFKGYVDATAKANVCATLDSKTTFLPAPELTRAQGDLKVLESRLLGEQKDCKKSGNACTEYSVKYDFIDGAKCSGNND